MTRQRSALAPSQLRDLSWRLTPAGRRWRRLLASLALDPDRLPRPVTEPGAGDFIICGAPRTGTTLLTSMLWQPPSVVTVMEPWDGLRLAPAALFASLREEIETTGSLSRGRLDVAALLREGKVRWTAEHDQRVALTVEAGYRLGVKWPAYWRYLGLLPTTRFLVCLRHPYEVISSFEHASRRLAGGADYLVPYNRQMNAEIKASSRDPAVRRVALYDYINERILPYLSATNVLAVRYERWHSESETVREEIGNFLGVELRQGAARLRQSSGADRLSARDRCVIRSHCRTATQLGYELD